MLLPDCTEVLVVPAGGFGWLRVPSAHSVWGSNGDFRSTGPFGANGGSVRLPSGGIAEGNESSEQHPAGDLPGRFHRRSFDALRRPPPAGRASLSDPDFVASVRAAAAPELAAALATANRDDSAGQQEGCVPMRELQLYRRADGQPWLLGRGSNGMV